jgi:AraC family transcriptional regulator of adaptative response/methylated-DNA-[protein]-cysteine methyltransferase
MNAAGATQAVLDYQRIEKAIAFLDEHFLEQPELPAVARAAHMSEFHFQRVFTRWAGISPKRFLQFLTVEHAKQQLLRAKPVLDAALDSGLSSPGRLHDLFVAAEAVTPGEFKSRGAGVQISYGFHATRFGECLIGVTQRGVCWLGFLSNEKHRRDALAELRGHWLGAEINHDPDETAKSVRQIFGPLSNGGRGSLSLLLMGTNFQIKVWQALLRIPAGTLVSYDTIAEAVCSKNAARAAGAAIGQNSIAYLIPCHRVIRKTGALGGYRWGETRKRAMLAWESARAAA